MYSATCLLLNLSFAYRLYVLRMKSQRNHEEIVSAIQLGKTSSFNLAKLPLTKQPTILIVESKIVSLLIGITRFPDCHPHYHRDNRCEFPRGSLLSLCPYERRSHGGTVQRSESSRTGTSHWYERFCSIEIKIEYQNQSRVEWVWDQGKLLSKIIHLQRSCSTLSCTHI